MQKYEQQQEQRQSLLYDNLTEIVKDYSDEGKSGLNIEGREALSQLLEDVRSGRASFSCILVYDVSRWGRFQDADESAHYEYTCRNAGVAVHFCTEQFENELEKLGSTIRVSSDDENTYINIGSLRKNIDQTLGLLPFTLCNLCAGHSGSLKVVKNL